MSDIRKKLGYRIYTYIVRKFNKLKEISTFHCIIVDKTLIFPYTVLTLVFEL